MLAEDSKDYTDLDLEVFRDFPVPLSSKTLLEFEQYANP